MNNGSAYRINRISSFKTLSRSKPIRKEVALISLILLWANNACAQELWSKQVISYSNVTAQFNIAASTTASKTINQTVISVYSDSTCTTSALGSHTFTQSKNFTFYSSQSYSVNATSFYQACTTYLFSDGRCANGTIHSVRIQPRITGTNIFTGPPQPCFSVNASSGTKIVLTGSAANVAFS